MKEQTEHFECIRCGTCCQWEGYVRLRENEIEKIANFLDLRVHEFTENYTMLTEDRQNLSLIEKEDGSCIFFNSENNDCNINPVKPVQCRNFPLVWNFEGWEKFCQGKNKGARTWPLK